MARAKQTRRAEARRRYRQSTAQTSEDIDITEEGEEAPAGSASGRGSGSGKTPASGRPAPSTGQGRPGLGAAFREAYRPAHFREDIAALPSLLVQAQPTRIPFTRSVVGIPWFLVSAFLVILGFIAVLAAPPSTVSGLPGSSPAASVVASPGASAGAAASAAASSQPSAGPTASPGPAATPTPAAPADSSSGFAALLFQLLAWPPGGPTLPVLLVGFTATRASYLQGLLIGLLDLVLIVIYVATVPSATSTTAGLGDFLLSASITGLPTSVLFAGAAAWYRRFLQLSSPRRAQQRPTGRGRTTSRQAPRR